MFDEALQSFIDGCQALVDRENLFHHATIVRDGGNKFLRISRIEVAKDDCSRCGERRLCLPLDNQPVCSRCWPVGVDTPEVKREEVAHSAYCFVALDDGQNRKLGAYRKGDIFKPDGFKGPARHARGNILDEHNGLRYMSWTGPGYLR